MGKMGANIPVFDFRRMAYNEGVRTPVAPQQDSDSTTNGRLLFRQLIPILFRPIAVRRHCLQRRPALGPAGARAFRFCFRHTSAGLCFQARANIDRFLSFFSVLVRFARVRGYER